MKAKVFIFDIMYKNPVTDALRIEKEINDFLANDPDVVAVEHGPDCIIFLYNNKGDN